MFLETECVVGQEFALDHKDGECSKFKCKFLEDCSPDCWISYDECPDDESQGNNPVWVCFVQKHEKLHDIVIKNY